MNQVIEEGTAEEEEEVQPVKRPRRGLSRRKASQIRAGKRRRGRQPCTYEEKIKRCLTRLKIFFDDDQLQAELHKTSKDVACDNSDKSVYEKLRRILHRARVRIYRSDPDNHDKDRDRDASYKQTARARALKAAAAADADQQAKERLEARRLKDRLRQKARREKLSKDPAFLEKDRLRQQLARATRKLASTGISKKGEKEVELEGSSEEVEQVWSSEDGEELSSETNIFGYEPLLV